MTAIDSTKGTTGYDSPKPAKLPPATREEMSAARIPLQYRDGCANYLIPLNRCRFEEYYLPWKCVDERHAYEKCQYEDFLVRVKKMEKWREDNPGKRAN